MRLKFLAILFFAANANANEYCKKYDNIFSFVYQNAKSKACIAGEKAFFAHNPEFCAKLAIVGGKEDKEIFLACDDGYKHQESLTVVNNATIKKSSNVEEIRKEVPKHQNLKQ